MDAEQRTITVVDVHGRRRRGVVTRGLAPRAAPRPPAEFCVALVSSQERPKRVPASTAICVPSRRRPSTRRRSGADPSGDMRQYRGGAVVLMGGRELDARRAFPRGSPDFGYIARALLEIADAEAIAPYTGLIRHALGLAPGADATAALSARLSPAEARDRPPARAPGVIRLKAALRRLAAHRVPRVDLEQFGEDLRLLAVIAERAWPQGGLGRLLRDVERAPFARGSVPARPTFVHVRGSKGAR